MSATPETSSPGINCALPRPPGDHILLVSFGQGCDAVVLRATERLPGFVGGAGNGAGIVAALANREPESNYQKFLAFNNLEITFYNLGAIPTLPSVAWGSLRFGLGPELFALAALVNAFVFAIFAAMYGLMKTGLVKFGYRGQ